MSRVLIIGCRGVLGTLTARAFAGAGWEVHGAARRPVAGQIKIELDRRDSVAAALRGHDLVVNTVPHPGLWAERIVLERGGVLINTSALPAAAGRALRAVAGDARGTVLMNAGLAPGVTNLVAAHLLHLHPEAHELQIVITLSSTAPRGPASAQFVRRGLTAVGRHRTIDVRLPGPFGERRCIGFGEGDAGWLGGVAEGRAVRVYICVHEPAAHRQLLELNDDGAIDALPRALIGSRRLSADGSAGSEPVGHLIVAKRCGRRLDARTVQCRGDFRHAALSTVVFAQALLEQTRSPGCVDPEEAFCLTELASELRGVGIRIEPQFAQAPAAIEDERSLLGTPLTGQAVGGAGRGRADRPAREGRLLRWMTASATGPQLDATRVIADLRELERRTGGPTGARRVAWGEQWREARAFLQQLLEEIGLRAEPDEAGNLWALLAGDRRPALAIGSHLDSVPSGGWLDGALGVMAAVGVLRAFVESGERPSSDLALVDWADEEGARFGHSLLGSSAFAGVLDVDAVRDLPDQAHERLADALASNGVDLDRAPEAGHRRAELACYLELHIEQGPVLEAEGLRAAAVAGCVGLQRHRFTFTGRTGHAGTTPMDRRRDAGLAAATTALAIERTAQRGGTATTGALELEPGIASAIAGRAELLVDLRHGDGEQLEAMLTAATEAARAAAAQRGCALESQQLVAVEPVAFDEQLVALARAACVEVTGADRVLTSGALHDAVAVARRLPAAMMFAPSIGGVSHAADEDTADADLGAAIETFGVFVQKVLGALCRGDSGAPSDTVPST